MTVKEYPPAHEDVTRFDGLAPSCPFCGFDAGLAPGTDVPLRLTATHSTDWYGELRYWRCPCCRQEFVSSNGGEVDEA